MHPYYFRAVKQNLVLTLFIIFMTLTVPLSIMQMKDKPETISSIANHTIVLTASYPEKLQCIIYTKEHEGRLGNRMFMVASAYGLARLHSCQLYLTPRIVNKMSAMFNFDLSPFLISSNLFSSTIHNISKLLNASRKNVGCDYIIEMGRPNAIPTGTIFELKGYWQSYLHFVKYSDDIREHLFAGKRSVLEKISKLFIELYQRKFNFKPQFLIKNHQSFKAQLAQLNWTTWIGIHVRRKDFVPLHFASDDKYLFSAIEYYTRRYPNAHFLISSDDKSYCRKLFRHHTNIYFTPQLFSESTDLVALSLCEHSIVTGGTFGWWAAYLANGEVIHDRVYPTGCKRREHYYPSWFLINGNVRAHKNSNYTS